MNGPMALLEQAGIIQRGHFLLPDGRHSDMWIDRNPLTEEPDLADPLLNALADLLRPFRLDRLTGASTYGLIVAHQVARLLGARYHSLDFTQSVPHVDPFAELREERVAVVEDFAYRAEQFDPAVRAVRSKGAKVVALGALVAFPIRPADLPVERFECACPIVAQVFPADRVPERLGQIPVQRVQG